MGTDVTVRRFSADEFQRMAEAGVFTEDDRLELLDGEIIQMNPVGRRHVAVVNRLTRLFARVQPQPDVVLLRPREDDYEGTMPAGDDAYLVVEVSDSTVEYDTTCKVPAYARGAVPAVWIVALATPPAGDRVLVFEAPANGTYGSQRTAHRGETLTIPGLAEASIAVSDFL